MEKYSESYRNDFDTWLKVLGIVSNEIYRYRPCLPRARETTNAHGITVMCHIAPPLAN